MGSNNSSLILYTRAGGTSPSALGGHRSDNLRTSSCCERTSGESSQTCGWRNVAQLGQLSRTPGHTHQYTHPDPQTHPRSCRCPPEFPRKQRGTQNARWLRVLSRSYEFWPLSSFVWLLWMNAWWLLTCLLTSPGIHLLSVKNRQWFLSFLPHPTILIAEYSLQTKMYLQTQRCSE